jgi:SAM-dependent methyltransferase
VRYKVRGFEIRSENAAKPKAQTAKPLVRWLKNMGEVRAALDFGCGKLRYSEFLARKCEVLTLVDSAVQLDRRQRLGGKETTVRQYAQKQLPRCRILSVEEFSRDRNKYDFILCANVLSAIPDRRIRSSALRRLGSAMRNTSQCLFVSQYRNSCFKEMAASPNALPHLDGWILRTPRGSFYYGILNRDGLSRLVLSHGLRIKKSWTEGESAYLLAELKSNVSLR